MRLPSVFKRAASQSASPHLLCTSHSTLPLSLNGLLLPLHKPVGPTSQQCLTRLKRLIGGKKFEVFESPGSQNTVRVGYAGTLDPLASGLLVCGFGKATRDLLSFRSNPMHSRFSRALSRKQAYAVLSDSDKTYSGAMRLGNVTDSRDAATAEKWPEPRDVTHISDDVLCETAASFVGQYEQVSFLSRACVRVS